MASLYACLQGTTVAITAVAGPFRSCARCGGTSATVNLNAPGTHSAELICTSCMAHTAWLGRDHLAAMLAQQRGAA
jgi:hypothetical protein